jgi:hypothetical protein
MVLKDGTVLESLFEYTASGDTCTITKYHGKETAVVIPETIDGYTVVAIGKEAFRYTDIVSVVIPDGVREIQDYAFGECTYLKDITIPDSVTVIGAHAFENTDISSIIIPESVTSIGDYTFSGCNKLKEVIIPESVKSIGEYAFSGCRGLGSITIPGSVTSIGDYAFYTCHNLSEIIISEGVTSIGDYAFAECVNLYRLTLPASITEIGNNVFYDDSYQSFINKITYGGTKEEWDGVIAPKLNINFVGKYTLTCMDGVFEYNA